MKAGDKVVVTRGKLTDVKGVIEHERTLGPPPNEAVHGVLLERGYWGQPMVAWFPESYLKPEES